MLPTTIRSPPALDDYTPLAEHQSHTPETFFGGKPVLYYHAVGAKAWIPKSQWGSLPIFPADGETSEPSGPEAAGLEGAEELVERKIDLFVTSETFTIFSSEAECGVSIPYPVITLHAIKHYSTADDKIPSVYLQLELADGGADDDTFDTVELTIFPPAPSPSSDSGADAQPEPESQRLFDAISECSNLNPDPAGEDDDEDGSEYDGMNDRIIFESSAEAQEAVAGFTGVYRGAGNGGLPPPMPGSSGWITAENVHEYFDEEGNWIGEEEGVSGQLGEGAGRVRGRDETEGEGLNGHDEDEDAENKRPRTE